MAEFTDHGPVRGGEKKVVRRDYLFSAGGHVLLVILGLISFSGGAAVMPMGDGAISVTMVNLGPEAPVMVQSEVVPEEVPVQPEEVPEVVPEEVPVQPEEVPEEVPEEAPVQPEEVPEEAPEETPVQPEEVPEENPPVEAQPATSTYASLTGSGTAGAGVPGPGTYESRVFSAIRRGFRTSVEPDRSYRIVFTVNRDGSTSVEVVRSSGTSAFDRAVENALALAQIPPMPPGRTTPVNLNIEFFGPE